MQRGDKLIIVRNVDTTIIAGLTALGKIATAATAKNVAVDPQTHAVWTTFTNGKDSFAKSWIQP